METESPSQPRPAVIHKMCNSGHGGFLLGDSTIGNSLCGHDLGISFSDPGWSCILLQRDRAAERSAETQFARSFLKNKQGRNSNAREPLSRAKMVSPGMSTLQTTRIGADLLETLFESVSGLSSFADSSRLRKLWVISKEEGKSPSSNVVIQTESANSRKRDVPYSLFILFLGRASGNPRSKGCRSRAARKLFAAGKSLNCETY